MRCRGTLVALLLLGLLGACRDSSGSRQHADADDRGLGWDWRFVRCAGSTYESCL
jgi:hypothetical protein